MKKSLRIALAALAAAVWSGSVAGLVARLAAPRPAPPRFVSGASTKVSSLSSVGTVHSDDLLMVVDVHDQTMASTGTDKKGTINKVVTGSGTAGQLVGVGSDGTPTAFTVSTGLAVDTTAKTVTATGSGTGGGTGGSGTVNTGSSGQVAYYAATGAAVSGASLSSLLDGIGSAQGDVLYRGASGWSVLAPGTTGQVLTSGGASANPSWTTVSGGGGGTGTVTSVDMTVPSWLAVTGNPITTTGTLALSAAGGQAANQVLATPNGSSGAASLRALALADLPTVTAAKGGTGLTATPTNGQLLIGNGSGFSLASLAAGSNVTITPGPGTITIAASSGGGSSLQGVLVNGTALTNSTATTDLGSGGTTLSGTFTVAANRLAAGTIIRIRAGGVYTGNGAAGLGIKLYLDGATGTPIMVPASGGPTLPTVTSLPWSLDAALVCHAAGATGSIGGMGSVRYTGASSGGTSDLNGSLKEYPTSGTPTTIDTTASHVLSIIGAWNTASSAVSVQMTDFSWWIEG